ncbi:aldo/keto reductase [Puniceicoccus vermicola]|uniref:Aldo/keto reductase n=1 Tax=Puniceicoccus vermicola TaxID=388746 RepID=A0A7X1AVB1_9BACT|nr:aldo/keto reductase [Puniceicoccus vermicola]MBC2600452.1 aldo/keto reductase [Puniceicoccus vermicola]
MKYRTLGSTGLEVSVIGVGTWQFGGEWGRTYSESDASKIFAAARDSGINLIDTAECYGDHLSESLIGASVAENREDWIIATKFGHHFKKNFDRNQVIDPESVVKQLEDSLRALRTDYVDLYQFHSLDDQAFATEGLWEALAKEKEKGKIRHLGTSIGSNTNSHQVKASPDVGSEVIQVVYNRLDRAPESEVLPTCQEENLGVLARVPLASGYLSGKYKPGAQFPSNDVRNAWHTDNFRDSRLREVEKIQREEVPEGTDMAQWALAWCLKNPAVTSVIPGCKDADQTRKNAAAADLLE